MSSDLYRDLQWLRPAPPDFLARCRAAECSEKDPTAALRALADHALDEAQLARLARALSTLRATGRAPSGLQPFRLGVVSNATTHLIAPALVATGLRHGLALECLEADFGQVMSEALLADSALNRARPDAVLVALDYRGLPLAAVPGDEAAENAAAGAALEMLQAVRKGFHQHSGALCLLQTLAAPPERLFGSLDIALAATQARLVARFNRALCDSLDGTPDRVIDIAGLAATVGLAQWHDPTAWHLAKLPFGADLVPLYADQVCRTLAALRGRSRRCLVLDLDNTLWGGVIGDDGLGGIRLGQGDAVGEAHLAVQQAARALRERGVVLAVSSKNDDAAAREPFREHPDMLLREDDIAVFQANWSDKAANLRAIAQELSLGLDALVLLDDNPAEREQVRRALPEVAVPELPDNPALFARTLMAAGYFEAAGFVPEDRQRAEFYRQNARRVALQRASGDLGDYLASLEMVATVEPFNRAGRARIVQLINKSNQYNLTTRRYDEAEVERIEQDPAALALQVRLSDMFGDNGMISVVICRAASFREWEVDTWLMSCRVLARRVEHAVLNEVIAQLRARGVHRLLGRYRPTPRNRLVADHYERLGFRLLGRNDDDSTLWQLELDRATPHPVPMRMRRIGMQAATAEVS